MLKVDLVSTENLNAIISSSSCHLILNNIKQYYLPPCYFKINKQCDDRNQNSHAQLNSMKLNPD